MAINLSQIRDLLLPGLRGVEGKYSQIPSQYDKVFEITKSNMALERTAEMRYLGLAQLKQEGGNTQFDNAAGERYVYNQEHNEIALGYAITRKAIDDNLYKAQFKPTNLGLTESFHQTKEIYAANVLNTAQIMPPAAVGTVWGNFIWGSALWSGSAQALSPQQLPWTEPIVFTRMQLQATGQSAAGVRLGTWHFRYQILRYLTNLVAA